MYMGVPIKCLDWVSTTSSDFPVFPFEILTWKVVGSIAGSLFLFFLLAVCAEKLIFAADFEMRCRE